jgi:hypothetical protein
MNRALVILLCAVLAACSSARTEFDKTLDQQVDKPLDDPQGFRALNKDKRIYTGRLANGHVQEEYKVGFRDECRVYLEVDPQQNKVLNWRFDPRYSDMDCTSPNVGR